MWWAFCIFTYYCHRRAGYEEVFAMILLSVERVRPRSSWPSSLLIPTCAYTFSPLVSKGTFTHTHHPEPPQHEGVPKIIPELGDIHAGVTLPVSYGVCTSAPTELWTGHILPVACGVYRRGTVEYHDTHPP